MYEIYLTEYAEGIPLPREIGVVITGVVGRENAAGMCQRLQPQMREGVLAHVRPERGTEQEASTP
jgi:hypothetical protein